KVLDEQNEFIWDEDTLPQSNYLAMGQRLAAAGDIFRLPGYAGGLLLGPDEPIVEPVRITAGSRLAAIIADRVAVRYMKSGNTRGNLIPSRHLSTMLNSEVFLQRFQAVDDVVKTAHYLPDFSLMQPGYNNGGTGNRFLYVGTEVQVAHSLDSIT